MSDPDEPEDDFTDEELAVPERFRGVVRGCPNPDCRRSLVIGPESWRCDDCGEPLFDNVTGEPVYVALDPWTGLPREKRQPPDAAETPTRVGTRGGCDVWRFPDGREILLPGERPATLEVTWPLPPCED